MKKAFKSGVVTIALISFVSVVQAAECDNTTDDPCAHDSYSIVETEPNTYWPHNEMAAAHWIRYKLNNNVSRRHRVVHRHSRHKRSRSIFHCRKSR